MNVNDFENQTSYCPLHLAWRVVDEARDYFRTSWIPSPGTLSHPMGEELADKLARRAEAVFAHQPFWQRKFRSSRGREAILMAMRHWLAGALARENPVLFRQLPESFKIGIELPDRMDFSLRSPPGSAILSRSRGRGKPGAHGVTRPTFGSRGRSPHHPNPRFVHGCELLDDLSHSFGLS